ncbi:uncharacterized protein LOC117332287 [Pecten maximus]|uniref:uncharacterized protein LOC117332287 n=1 Tax=Pecten maximus TaxID=6579 RepID=UPI001458D099|nr:uncharacterized protein LOC117332287 [Pecten maximus]
MEKQVCSISKACYYQVRNIGRIRQFITMDACKTLVHSLVTSRLDYGNALLYGVPANVSGRLQKLQNTAARLVTRTRKRDHITHVLMSLHWLPVEYRFQYKMLMYTYKALNGLAPMYLRDLVTPYVPSRSLRSEHENYLVEPKTRTKTYGDRRFDKAAASLWNRLPLKIRSARKIDSFKTLLKTHLFKLAFN